MFVERNENIFVDEKLGDSGSYRVSVCTASVMLHASSIASKQEYSKNKTFVCDTKISCISCQKRRLLVGPFQLDKNSSILIPFGQPSIISITPSVLVCLTWLSIPEFLGWKVLFEDTLDFLNLFLIAWVDGFVGLDLWKSSFPSRMSTCSTVRSSTIFWRQFD